MSEAWRIAYLNEGADELFADRSDDMKVAHKSGFRAGYLAAQSTWPAERAEMVAALERIAHPQYGLGFNKLRGIARKTLIDLGLGRHEQNARALVGREGK